MSLSKQIRNDLMEMVVEVAGVYNDLIPGLTTEEELEPVIEAVERAVNITVEKLINHIALMEVPVPPEVKPKPPVSRLLPQPEPTPEPTPAPVAQTLPAPPLTLPNEAQQSLSEVAGLGDDMAVGDGDHHLGMTLEQERRIQEGKPANPARPHVVIDHTGSKEYPTEKHFREAGAVPPVAVPRTVVAAPPSAAPRAAVNPDLEEAVDDNPKV